MNLEGLDRALKALGPYVGELVLCGGWAWYLYRRCLGAQGKVEAQFTRDLDCIGIRGLKVIGQPAAQLLRDAGFQWSPQRGHEPPAARFAWPDPDRPLAEIEFLTPARGAGARPTEELQPGLVAQVLRHLDVLRESPLKLVMDDTSPLARELTFRGIVQVPQVGGFAIQKARIASQRSREQQVKDFFYVFDLLDPRNGLADRLLSDTVRAEPDWPEEVGAFVALLRRRVDEPVFLRGVAAQYPPEARPREAYVREETRRFSEALDRHRGHERERPA